MYASGVQLNFVDRAANIGRWGMVHDCKLDESACLESIKGGSAHFLATPRGPFGYGTRGFSILVKFERNFSFSKEVVSCLCPGGGQGVGLKGQPHQIGEVNHEANRDSLNPDVATCIDSSQDPCGDVAVVGQCDRKQLRGSETGKPLNHRLRPDFHDQSTLRGATNTVAGNILSSAHSFRDRGPACIAVTNDARTSEYDVTAKCGNLAVTIICTREHSAIRGCSSPTVGGDDNSLLSLGNNDDSARGYLIPGACIWQNKNRKKGDEHFYLRIVSNNTSMAKVSGRHLTLWGYQVFMSHDGNVWKLVKCAF